ncbi:Ionotropic receptor 93a [Blattella germanica]|nr:Ionotropic receptor 93a [Blattella germanica]
MILRKWIVSFFLCFNLSSGADSELSGFTATLALVVDKNFKGVNYQNFSMKMRHYLRETIAQHLKHGKLYVKIFTPSDINMPKDTLAVLTIMPCENTWDLYYLFQKEEFLHIAITEGDCPRLPRNEGITVPLVTIHHSSSQVILDIKTTQLSSWTTCTVLYDDSTDIQMVERIIKSLSVPSLGREDNVATVSVFKIGGSHAEWERRKSVTDLLQDFPTRILGSNFVVSVSNDIVGILMKASKSVGLSNPENQWLYLISDLSALSHNMSGIISLLTEGENIAFVYNTTSTDKNCKGGVYCHAEELLKSFIIALDRTLVDEIEMMEQVSVEEWEYIRPSKSKRRSDILHLMQVDMNDGGHCDDCSSWTLEAGDTWGLDYLPTEQSRQLIPVGKWTPQKGIEVVGHLFPHILHGFGGRILPLVTLHDPPWQIIGYNETGQYANYKGFMFKIINEMSKHLNFSYTVMFPTDSKEGWTNDTGVIKERDANSTSTFIETEKIIDLIRKKKVFLAVGAFTVTERRKTLVNFTIPISIEAATLLTSRPGEISRALIFIAPFTYDTWICIIIMIAIMTPIINYFHRHSPYYEYFYGTSIKGGLNSIFNVLWYVYGALMQQGGMHLPEADSGRILVGAWWLVVLVIVTSYGGNLVAFLTFPRYKDSITNLEDLMANKGKVSWGILKDSSIEDHLKDSDLPRFKNFLQGCRAHEMEDPEVMAQVRSGSHVYVDWKINLLFLMKKEFLSTKNCDFTLGEEDFLEDQVAMMMKLKSPYLGMVNEQLRRLHQSGLIYKWYVDHHPRKDRCWGTSRIMEATTHTVNLDDMQGSFIVLGLGCVSAMIIIMLEFCYHFYKLSKEKRVVKPYTT